MAEALSNASEDRVSYRADLYALYQYARKGVHSQGGAYRFHSLRSRYPKEHAEFKAEAQGQGELL